MNIITNAQFEEALNVVDNQKIMEASAKRYRKTIGNDEILGCKLIALWEALRRFDPAYGCKFTSYLYKLVDSECQDVCARIRKEKRVIFLNKNDYDLPPIDLDLVSILPQNLADLVQKRYLENRTTTEIAKIYKCSRETIRRRLNKALNKLREVYCYS